MWSAWAVWCYDFVLAEDGSYSKEYTDTERLKLFYTADVTLTRDDTPNFRSLSE